MLKLGTPEMKKLYLGNAEMKKAYLGSQLVYQKYDLPDMSSLAFWLDASKAQTILSNAGSVQSWSDPRGAGFFSATQLVGAKKPITGVSNINSKNVLQFNIANQSCLELPSGLYNIPQGDSTVFVVMALDSNHQGTALHGEGAPNLRYRLLHPSWAAQNASHYALGSQASTAMPADTTPRIVAMRRSGTQLIVKVGAGAWSASSGTPAINFALTNLWIGAQAGASNFLGGKIAEMAGYTTAKTDAEVNIIANSFASKWGVPWVNA